jgi:hypothetical protein
MALSAVEQREDELLIEATGKSETERKANYAQAKRKDDELKNAKAAYEYEAMKQGQLEAQLTTLEQCVLVGTVHANLTAAELNAIGREMAVANG